MCACDAILAQEPRGGAHGGFDHLRMLVPVHRHHNQCCAKGERPLEIHTRLECMPLDGHGCVCGIYIFSERFPVWCAHFLNLDVVRCLVHSALSGPAQCVR